MAGADKATLILHTPQ